VWILVAGLVASYVYAVRVIGPKVAPEGRVVTRRQVGAFSAMIALLWLSSDWPVHDLAEEYLYSVHMIQHMALSYFVPPLALLATPEWLARLLLGQGRAYARARVLVLPVVAAVTYNAVVMITHIPALVNRSAEGGPLHYGLHVILVTTSLMMWTPICGPIPEWRIGYGAQMIYLFSMSLLPTIPAGWLTFAENAVYGHYDTPVRVWGMTVLSDQQAAGGRQTETVRQTEQYRSNSGDDAADVTTSRCHHVFAVCQAGKALGWLVDAITQLKLVT
jgi:putative membrane protein